MKGFVATASGHESVLEVSLTPQNHKNVSLMGGFVAAVIGHESVLGWSLKRQTNKNHKLNERICRCG